jgi:MFS family permease
MTLLCMRSWRPNFAVYAFMAPYIGRVFFPATDPYVSVLTTFAVFGVGFLARPVGALVIGRIGDTKGRRVSLIVSIVTITVGTVLIGILPSYATIGIAAPILVVLARLLQGFSIGGEWGNAVAFLVEWAPKNRRGAIRKLELLHRLREAADRIWRGGACCHAGGTRRYGRLGMAPAVFANSDSRSDRLSGETRRH